MDTIINVGFCGNITIPAQTKCQDLNGAFRKMSDIAKCFQERVNDCDTAPFSQQRNCGKNVAMDCRE